MIRLESSHFANVIGAVQRTGSLTGGAVRGLPNGVVIGGLTGINSFPSAISEAQKEFQLGRPRTSLERIRQLETSFNGLVGRWNSTVMSLIAGAKQGRQGIPLQKLNEVKNAQTRMQQLTGPVSKAFRDLVTALEQEITMDGHESAGTKDDRDDDGSDPKTTPSTSRPAAASEDETPDLNSLGSFAANYRYGTKLHVQRGEDKKRRIKPRIEKHGFYFVAGLDPPRVVRVNELQAKAVLVFDTLRSSEVTIDANQLLRLIKQGIWTLEQGT